MNLSIIIPAYNEASRIKRSLEIVSAFCQRELNEWEVIVVDDGSTDATSAQAASVARVQCLRNARNRGKGYSVRRGMLAAKYDVALFTDADLSAPIEECLALYKAIEKGADLAIASRKPAGDKEVRRRFHRKLMASVFRALVKFIALRGFFDTQCGFKMFRRRAIDIVFPLQRIERWGFDVELLHIALKENLRVVEVPVTWHESQESRLKSSTPLTMLADLLRIRWNSLLGRYRRRTPSGEESLEDSSPPPPGRLPRRAAEK